MRGKREPRPVRAEPLVIEVLPTEFSRLFGEPDLYVRIGREPELEKHSHQIETDPTTGRPPARVEFPDGCILLFAVKRETWEDPS